jgi:hypothetical protein
MNLLIHNYTVHLVVAYYIIHYTVYYSISSHYKILYLIIYNSNRYYYEGNLTMVGYIVYTNTRSRAIYIILCDIMYYNIPVLTVSSLIR